MPSYEYRCKECGKKFEIFMSYEEYGTRKISCPKCSGEKVVRKIGRIRVARSDDRHLEDFSDMDSLDGLEDDPVSLGRLMRKMSKEVGEEMPPEFDEVVGRLESGQSPEEIERDLPDMGADDGGSGDFGGFPSMDMDD